MKKYRDNRDIRNKMYQGDLIIEVDSRDPRGVSKEEAEKNMRNILKRDIQEHEMRIKAAKKTIEKSTGYIELINKKANEIYNNYDVNS